MSPIEFLESLFDNWISLMMAASRQLVSKTPRQFCPVSYQRRKLCFKEDDWKLVAASGSLTTSSSSSVKTRHGGAGRPNLKKKHCNEPESSSSSSDSESKEMEEDDGLEAAVSDLEEDFEMDEELEERMKPPSTNVIVEMNSLVETLQKNCHCSDCHGPVDVAIKTVCLASCIVLSCKNTECSFVYNSPTPAAANIGTTEDDRERTTDYAINILYVLAFCSAGDGGAEAGRLLGLLGL